MFDIRGWMNDIRIDLHNISNPHCFVLEENSKGDVVLRYKNWTRDEKWLPSGNADDCLPVLKVREGHMSLRMGVQLPCFCTTWIEKGCMGFYFVYRWHRWLKQKNRNMKQYLIRIFKALIENNVFFRFTSSVSGTLSKSRRMYSATFCPKKMPRDYWMGPFDRRGLHVSQNYVLGW